MNLKKLQIFISSTYKDLQEERQAAVEAILSVGHIPAGMELFTAGNESQLETIKRWIEGSDVYLLILGGRYGALEPKSQKSYTHVEYEYAIEKGIPVFAVVINEGALDAKVKKDGQGVLELENPGKYKGFKKIVLSKTSKFFDDTKDIKIAIHGTLAEFQRNYQFAGWVSGKEVESSKNLMEDNIKLYKENIELTSRAEKLSKASANGVDEFEKIQIALSSVLIEVPEALSKDKSKVTLMHIVNTFQDMLAVGVTNQMGIDALEKFLFYNVASKLFTFNLVEKTKVPAKVQWEKIHTSKFGHEFLKYYMLKNNVISKTKKEA